MDVTAADSQGADAMGPKGKKILSIVVLVFFVYAIFTSPDKAAGIIGNIWGVVVDGFNSILRFFDSLLSRT